MPYKGYKQTPEHIAAVVAGRARKKRKAAKTAMAAASEKRRTAMAATSEKRRTAKGKSKLSPERLAAVRRAGQIRWEKYRAAQAAGLPTAATRRTTRTTTPTPTPDANASQESQASQESLAVAFAFGHVLAWVEQHSLRSGVPLAVLSDQLGRLLHNQARGALVGPRR